MNKPDDISNINIPNLLRFAHNHSMRKLNEGASQSNFEALKPKFDQWSKTNDLPQTNKNLFFTLPQPDDLRKN